MTRKLSPNFRMTRFQTGYDITQVDEFVERINAELATPCGSLSVREIENARFAPVRFESGYSMDDVDNFLDHQAIPVLRAAQSRAGFDANGKPLAHRDTDAPSAETAARSADQADATPQDRQPQDQRDAADHQEGEPDATQHPTEDRERTRPPEPTGPRGPFTLPDADFERAWGAGYDIDEVDAFVETLREQAADPDSALTVADLEQKRFTVVRLVPCYASDSVDAFLADAASRMRGAYGASTETEGDAPAGAHLETGAAAAGTAAAAAAAATASTSDQSADAETADAPTPDPVPAAPATTSDQPVDTETADAPTSDPVPAASSVPEPVMATETAPPSAPERIADGTGPTESASSSEPAGEDLEGVGPSEFELSSDPVGEDLEGVGPSEFELSSDPAGEDLEGVGPSDDAGPVRRFGD